MESNDLTKLNLQRLQSLKNGGDEWPDDLSNGEFVTQVVRSLSYSHLYKHLDIILPFILKLTDHYRPENKVTGIRCLYYVIENITLNDLKSRGIDALIFDTLKRMLHHSEIEVISETLPCLLQAMKAFKLNPLEKGNVITQCDDVLFTIFRNIELTSDIHLRTVYMKNLFEYVVFVDSAIIKHNKKAVSLICDCLTHSPAINDIKLINNALNTLKTVIQFSKPVIDTHNCDILMVLFKLVFNVIEEPLFTEEEKSDVLNCVRSCVQMLKESNESEYDICFELIRLKCKNEAIKEVFSV